MQFRAGQSFRKSGGDFRKVSHVETWIYLATPGWPGLQNFGDTIQSNPEITRCLQFKEINARFEKIEPMRNMFEKQHSASAQGITPANRFSPPVNQNKSISHQAVNNQPVSELKPTLSGGSTRGNSPKSKLGSEGTIFLISSMS